MVFTSHGEDAHKHANVPPGEHDIFTIGVATSTPGFTGSPYPHAQDEEIKDNDSKQAFDMHLGSVWIGTES